jgi:hypothetical protein
MMHDSKVGKNLRRLKWRMRAYKSARGRAKGLIYADLVTSHNIYIWDMGLKQARALTTPYAIIHNILVNVE